MVIRDIYLYVCMYSVFYCTFTRASTNNLDYVTNTTFHVGGVALTNAAKVVLHTPLKKRKQIKEKAGIGERKPDRMSRKFKKSKVGGKNNLYNSQPSNHSKFV